ncbi:MAG: hydantoinase B/oxoprolinase family protein [Chloroflexi bacterium]|nr:hydantoinase B/oxoprolinase family protein [Chloroflexota bacterium]
MTEIDPVLVEIIQNRLTEIGREAGTAMVRTAASPVVIESKDFGFNICDHLGRTVVYSLWMPRHGTTLTFMLQSSLKRFGAGGIHPGDMVLVNNPYDGALHVLDLAVISPVHKDGELVAWTACATHHLDMRAMRPGLCSEATDWYQEGIVFRPIKLVERGQLREDLFDLIMDNVRVPLYTGLDLKSQIAANNVAGRRILEVVDRYGLEAVRACYDQIIEFSEAKARERIRLLPPGDYEADDYIDYDKRVHRVHCNLKVQDDTLTFDFTGTDPQAPTYVNSVLACSVANVHNILACMLYPDMAVNEGVFRPVKITIPEGTVLNCRPPAPCSGASTIGGWKAQALAVSTLAQALHRSPLSWRVTAGWGSGIVVPTISGLGRDQRPYVCMLIDGCMQGGGARATKDGLNTSNIAGSTNTSVPNVETMEQRFPVLYLKRGYVTDSAGAGKYRGGLAGEFVMKPHGVERAQCISGYVGRVAPPQGFAGGQPGVTSRFLLKRQTDVAARFKASAPTWEGLAGDAEDVPQLCPPFDLGPEDVWYVRCQGGGGYGDPLEREPTLVHLDVVRGYVSLQAAREVYGVVVKPSSLELDPEGTRTLREGRRSQGARATSKSAS